MKYLIYTVTTSALKRVFGLLTGDSRKVFFSWERPINEDRFAGSMAEIRRGGFHRVVLLTVVLLLVVTISTEADPEDEDCAECHGSFRHFEIVPQGPSEVPVGDTFEVGMIILNHEARGIHYEIRGIEAQINISGNASVELADGENATQTHDNIPRADSGAITWSLIASGTGPVEVSFEMVGVAHYDHDSSSPDDALYRLTETISFQVKDVGISLTEYSLTAFEGSPLSADIGLTSRYDITNVSFTPSASISGMTTITSDEPVWTDGFPEIPANATRTFTVTMSSREAAVGTIRISWADEHGNERQINLTVTVLAGPIETEAEVDLLRLAGRISGMIEIPMAAAVIILGGFPRQLKPRLMKLKKRRLSLHCNISYVMLAIAIFHMAVLLAGPFANVLFSGPMIMGFLALGFLIGLAVNGAAMKFLIKRMGRKYWHHMHVVFSIGFIVTMSFHAYKLGTEFAFLR